ncbi:hypothetical protein SASPL_135825 [Salvia splendens]|uniref:Beta-glucosidase n=1 Tax=Salvia splendens TaxID=180675 RepID=A0A8X8X094_SALSN|nr:hypothetical protein SASPL_135825 [Salvia splendens]
MASSAAFQVKFSLQIHRLHGFDTFNMGPHFPRKTPFISFSYNRFLLSEYGTLHYDFGSYKGSCWGQNYEENPSGSSFAIVVVGEGPYVESGGDSSDLKIPLQQSQTLQCLADQVPTLVILISGRPLAIEPQLLNKVPLLRRRRVGNDISGSDY